MTDPKQKAAKTPFNFDLKSAMTKYRAHVDRFAEARAAFFRKAVSDAKKPRT